MVRRHRPRGDLASPCRDRRCRAARAAHPVGVEPTRHHARRTARRDRGNRPRDPGLWAILPRWQSVVPAPFRGVIQAAHDAPGVREVRRILGGYERWRLLHRTTGALRHRGLRPRRARRNTVPPQRRPAVELRRSRRRRRCLLRLPGTAGPFLPVAARLPGRGGPRDRRQLGRSRLCDRSVAASTSCPANSRWSISKRKTAGTDIRSPSPALRTRRSFASPSRHSATTRRVCRS